MCVFHAIFAFNLHLIKIKIIYIGDHVPILQAIVSSDLVLNVLVQIWKLYQL